MRCSEIKKMVSPYADDALDLDSTRLVSLHLKRCEVCARYFDEVRAVGLISSRIERILPGRELETRILARIEEAAATPSPWERIYKKYIPDWRFAAVGSVFALLLFVYAFGPRVGAVIGGGNYAASAKAFGAEMQDSASFLSQVVREGKKALSGISRSLLGEPEENDAGGENDAPSSDEGASSGMAPNADLAGGLA